MGLLTPRDVPRAVAERSEAEWSRLLMLYHCSAYFLVGPTKLDVAPGLVWWILTNYATVFFSEGRGVKFAVLRAKKPIV